MKRAPLRSIACLVLGTLSTLALACASDPSRLGLDEPLRVQSAVLHDGALPGLPVDEQPEDPDDFLELTPRVFSVQAQRTTFRPGQAGITLRGLATEDAYSIAVRLQDVGSGYWVRPVGAPTGVPNELEWEARLDLSPDVPSGTHTLQLAAIDGAGHAGPHATVEICVTREVEDSRNACDPTARPPAAIISLSWDVNADLDLVVVTPSGATVDATHPVTIEGEDGEEPDPSDPGVGILSLDSNGSCELDGVRRETLTWNTSPEPGRYLVYAKLFEACGRQTSHFKVEAFARTRGDDEDTFGLAAIGETQHGVLLGPSATGDATRGLYVTTIEFP